MPRTPIIGGNWKCNGSRKSIAGIICSFNGAELLPGVEVVVACPSVYVDYAKTLMRPEIELALQDCHNVGQGAYTGEISPDMIKDIGLKWVIVGHSERRNPGSGSCGGGCEDGAFIASKVVKAMEEGLNVIYCVGELKEERVSGNMDAIVSAQMQTLLDAGVKEFGERLVIAYEPVWAIGTGLTATPAQAQEMHAFIRKWIATNVSPEAAEATRIQYGGSAKKANADELAAQPDIDGLLIGGASLKPEFIDCCNAFKVKL